MKFLLINLAMLIAGISFAQQNQFIPFANSDSPDQNATPTRTIIDEGVSGVFVKYEFEGAQLRHYVEGQTYFQKLMIKNFSYRQEVGKPAIPSKYDIFIIPEGSTADLVVGTTSGRNYNNFKIYPALEPASDEYGSNEPTFTIDSALYNTNAKYPADIARIKDIIKIKGINLAIVETNPVQFNPVTKQITVYSEINYSLQFGNANQFIEDKNNYSNNFLANLANIPLNSTHLNTEIYHYFALNPYQVPNDPNYIIVTHQDYIAAADSLAFWKSQMGYNVEIVSQSSWTAANVKSTIHNKYANYSPKPDYFTIIGDHDKVPGEVLVSGASSSANFASDLYFACMDGNNDYVPDMAYGRISVSGASQAMEVVRKIINYERYPISDTSFYSTGVNCAYFQHAGGGYAERRFAQTAEDVRNHLDTNHNYNVNRVYVTGSSVNPLYWNNGLYSNGEPLPNYLKKPTFAWDGNATDIINEINAGRFFVLHRDHGMSAGWGDPYFTSSNVNQLNNGDKLPVVFSINCLTGKFMDSECFAEAFLRKSNGGAVGVFAHGEISYSGYNDGLSLGLFDAMFSNPGLIPTFTGSGGVSNPTLTPHNDIYTMGDVKNQSLIRMIETWGGSASAIQYTHELFNYFGDPAMKIWTDLPTPITASHNDSLNCISDTSLNITNVNVDGIATLVVDGELLGSANVINGSTNLNFSGLNGDTAILTITAHNYKPYIAYITVSGGCPRAKFNVSATNYCLADSILVTDLSTGNTANYSWNFGSGATPSTSTQAGPFSVNYSSAGFKTITLNVSDTNGSVSTYTKSFYIDQYCKFFVPESGSVTISRCSGRLMDNGGDGDYTNNTQGTVTLTANGAASITLFFNSFHFESNYDYLKIYDGPSTSSTLIGTYTGTALPNNGIITSSTSSITIEQLSDSYVTESGFSLDWQCNMANMPPVCDFIISDSTTCTGEVQFHDYSLNGPSSWYWDFGDGNTSTLQNPSNIYTQNGVYDVKLITTNSHGSDSIIKSSVITVNKPQAPLPMHNIRCKAGDIDISAAYPNTGTIYWYDSPYASMHLDTGDILTVNNLSATDTFYAELHQKPSPVYGAKPDNSGGGGYYTYNSSHYLVFDSYEESVLHSVLVYSSQAGNRTILLKNSGGGLIKQKTVYIPAGAQRVILDFDLPVATNLQLVGPASPNLYRNNAGLNYPYNVSDIISIKESSASSDPTGYYYFFYDWEVYTSDCISSRVGVIAEINDTIQPIAGFNYNINDPIVSFSDTSLYSDSYYWDFGDGNFSTLQNPSHTYQSDNTFVVELKSTNQCGIDYASKSIQINASSINEMDGVSNFAVYPNPSKDLFNISFTSDYDAEVELVVLDILGKKCISKSYNLHTGENKLTVDLSDFAQGVYNLKLMSDKGNITKQIIKADK